MTEQTAEPGERALMAVAVSCLAAAEQHLRLAAETPDQATRVRRAEWAARVAGFRTMLESQERSP